MSDESLAEKVNTEAPWWAKAPIWLAAGIVGVPSLMAIGAGYFIASHVNTEMAELKVMNQVEIRELAELKNNQVKYWEMVRRTIAMTLEVQLRQCVNAAKTDKERENCLKDIANVK